MPRITVLDTTLRDGDQSPGFAFSTDEKLRIARLLEYIGVDIIEAGFPASSDRQFSDVVEVSRLIERSAVAAMSRAVPADIEKAGRALESARTKVLHTSIATSPIHRKNKLQMTRTQVIEKGADAVRYAKSFADIVEIGAEDARTEPDFLADFCIAMSESGADVINISDTVGFTQPDEFSWLIGNLLTDVHNFKTGECKLSIHCHNDLGCATANTLAGIKAGASQIEVTISGIGERSGNAPLEEVIQSLVLRNDYYKGITTGIDPDKLYHVAREIQLITGIPSSPTRPLIGRNNYIHASGIHQHGMINDPNSYSMLSKSDTGLMRTHFAISRHSGVAGISKRIEEIIGSKVDDETAVLIVADVKKIADDVRTVDATSLISILKSAGLVRSAIWKALSVDMTQSENDSSVTIILKSDDETDFRVVRSNGISIQSILLSLNEFFRRPIVIREYAFTETGNDYISSNRFFFHGFYNEREFISERYHGSEIEQFVNCYLDLINEILCNTMDLPHE